jgi:glutathione synthase
MRHLTLVFILDPPERLDPPTDTSLALMREGLARGHQVLFCTLGDLRLEEGSPRARCHPVVFEPGAELFTTGPLCDIPLAQTDVVFMRKDPPVDEGYLHATYLLDRLPETVLQVNPARALQKFCEKLIPLYFRGLAPETIVTRSPEELDDFLQRTGRIVVKPLSDCSGRGIFALGSEDPDRRALLTKATTCASRFVQGQRFLPEIAGGDKRVLLLGGEILGWVKRVPKEGDFRSNVNAGGHCVPCELTAGDRALCARLAPWLVREEIHLAGVDIVGSHVLEVNITSPSCLREMNDLGNLHLEQKVINYIETRCRI